MTLKWPAESRVTPGLGALLCAGGHRSRGLGLEIFLFSAKILCTAACHVSLRGRLLPGLLVVWEITPQCDSGHVVVMASFGPTRKSDMRRAQWNSVYHLLSPGWFPVPGACISLSGTWRLSEPPVGIEDELLQFDHLNGLLALQCFLSCANGTYSLSEVRSQVWIDLWVSSSSSCAPLRWLWGVVPDVSRDGCH